MKNVWCVCVCVWHGVSFFRKKTRNTILTSKRRFVFFPFKCNKCRSLERRSKERNVIIPTNDYYAKCNALRTKNGELWNRKHVTSQSIECIELEKCKSCVVIWLVLRIRIRILMFIISFWVYNLSVYLYFSEFSATLESLHDRVKTELLRFHIAFLIIAYFPVKCINIWNSQHTKMVQWHALEMHLAAKMHSVRTFQSNQKKRWKTKKLAYIVFLVYSNIFSVLYF